MAVLSPYEWAARQFEPRQRRYPSPLALGRHLDPKAGTSAALRLIDQALVDLVDGNGEENALMVFIPPQEGKSQLCSRRFPEWILEEDPEKRVAIISYEIDIALRWGRDIKRDIDLAGSDLPITIRADSKAAGRWETPQGGGTYCVGIGGPLSGKPVDCLRGDTEILTQNGYIRIRDIHRTTGKPYVLSYNHAADRTEWKPVIATREIPGRTVIEIRTAAGRIVHCTPDHRIYTHRGYVAAADLRAGERLLVAADGPRAMRPLHDRVPESPIDDLARETRDAAALQPGMPVRRRVGLPDLRPVRRKLHETPLRGGQGEGGRVHPVVLLAQMFSGGYRADVCGAAPMRDLRRTQDEPQSPLLLASLSAACGAGLRRLFAMRDHVRGRTRRGPEEDAQRADGQTVLARMPGSMALGAKHDLDVRPVQDAVPGQGTQVLLARVPGRWPGAEETEAMPAMRRGVHLLQHADRLLLKGLRRHGSRPADDRRGQLAFQDGHQLRRVVSADAPADPRARQGMPGLPQSGPRRASHQPPAVGQPAGEFDPALLDLPCGASQVEEDAVSVVRELRGERHTVYDLQVDGNRNFFAGQVLVHNCLIIDDPVKDRADAESERMRDRAWDWWESVAVARLGPDAKVVLIQTRWHQDDLGGRILARPSPLKWRVLKIPAIAGDSDVLGRLPGEELVSVRGRAPGHFLNLRATMSPYAFSSIFQQSPTAAEGNFFRRSTFRYWREIDPWSDGRRRLDLEGRIVTLTDCWRFGTVDVAASTKTSADYTVISMWAVAPEGDLILLDRARAQVAQHDHFGLAEPLFERWGQCPLYVERHFFATTLVTDAQAAGIPVAEVTADTDKVTRAVPAAGRVHAGRAWFPAETSGCGCGNCPDGVWLDEWCDELASFPTGTHDDQVDTLSYAARILTAEWTPPTTQPRRGVDPHERAVALAAGSAIGGGEVDLMNVPY